MSNDKFEYTYTALTKDEKMEIENIRNQYLPLEIKEKKIWELKKIDNKVKRKPVIISWILGTVGVLVFGLGLSMVLEWELYLWGLLVAFMGAILMLLAYPIYNVVYKFMRKRYGKVILEISEELLNEKAKL